jgi:hypothetical protein
MLKIFTLIAIILVANFGLNANSFSALWDNPRVVETNHYSLAIPTEWENFPIMSKGVERNFNISGEALPSTSSGVRVLGSFYVSFIAIEDSNKAVENVRQTKASEATLVETENFKGKNFKGVLVKSFNARKIAGRNGQRYDLVVSKKERGGSYVFSMYIQFNDSTGQFVKDNNLDELAIATFNHILFKNIEEEEQPIIIEEVVQPVVDNVKTKEKKPKKVKEAKPKNLVKDENSN